MKSAFKHLATVIFLLIISSSSIYANISTYELLDKSYCKNDGEDSNASGLSRNNYTFYTQNPVIKSHIITDSFLFEIEEEEEVDVKQLNSNKNSSSVKSYDSNFNQDFIKTTAPLKQKSWDYYFSFFKSKTATSLYLLFEVFRI